MTRAAPYSVTLGNVHARQADQTHPPYPMATHTPGESDRKINSANRQKGQRQRRAARIEAAVFAELR